MSNLLTARRSSRAISLTGLIDVVFILLMFFMLTSSFTRSGFLEFQTAASGGKASRQSQSLLLLANGDLVERVDAKRRSLSDSALLSGFDAREPLTVMPAGETTVQVMVLAIERLQRLGLANVTLGRAVSGTQDDA